MGKRGPHWIHIGLALDSQRIPIRFTMKASLAHIGFTLDSHWIHIGFKLDSYWIHIGFALDSLVKKGLASWSHKGLASGAC